MKVSHNTSKFTFRITYIALRLDNPWKAFCSILDIWLLWSILCRTKEINKIKVRKNYKIFTIWTNVHKNRVYFSKGTKIAFTLIFRLCLPISFLWLVFHAFFAFKNRLWNKAFEVSRQPVSKKIRQVHKTALIF